MVEITEGEGNKGPVQRVFGHCGCACLDLQEKKEVNVSMSVG